jgi:NIMA (never in mitosis gene a)-related kinase
MQSAVGTLSYNCPEIVQHQQYSDKADLWSVGCILYHLIALKPPFNDENPLVLANSIVEGNFKPLRASLDCSERLVNVVHSLLTPSPEARPAASSLASMIAPELICALDRLSVEQDHLLEVRRNALPSCCQSMLRNSLLTLTCVRSHSQKSA